MKLQPGQKAKLKDIIRVFLQIGATSFGSPTAHIAMMESEIVRKRKWLTSERFLELLAATHLVPGPNATELALHIGYLQAGYAGLLAAGASFILPSFLATIALAWVYTRYGSLPQVDAIFYALNPLVLAIVINTVWNLGKSCLKTWQTWLIFGLALGAHVRAASCALAQGASRRALPYVEAALRLAPDYETDSMYRGELWLVAARVYEAVKERTLAARMAVQGCAWVQDIADRHVPAAFRDSFLNRNATNRELFAQGMGNLCSGLLGGLPVTSVLARGSVNVAAGSHSKAATIGHGLLLGFALLALGKQMSALPLSSLLGQRVKVRPVVPP